MSAERNAGCRADGFAALRDLAVELAEAGDFRAAALHFRNALAAVSRTPPTPTSHEPSPTPTTLSGTTGASALAPPAITFAVSGPDGRPGLSFVASGSGDGPGRAAPSAPSAAARTDPGPIRSRRELAAAHDMLAQCLMELAVEGGGAAGLFSGELTGATTGKEQEHGELQLAAAAAAPAEVTAAATAAAGSSALGEAEAGEAGSGEEASAARREEQLWEEALRNAAEACRLLPRWVPARLTYARCLRNCGLLDEALRELNGAMQILDAGAESLPDAQERTPATPAQEEAQGAARARERQVARQVQPQAAPARGCCHQQQRHPVQPTGTDPWDSTEGLDPECDDEPEPGITVEVAEELMEVSELWQRRLARDVGLPGLRIRQDAGVPGEGPGRRVWECGVLLAAYLVQQAAPPTAGNGGGEAAAGGVAMGGDPAAIDLAGARVLELGCGSGLVGIAAAACGACCVLTDLLPVLHSTAACVAANAGLIRVGGGTAAVRPLDWADCGGGDGEGAGVTTAAAWLLAGQGAWATMAADSLVGGTLQAAESGGEADGRSQRPSSSVQRLCWVLGADLVYSAAQVDALVGTLVSLRRAAGRMVSAIPGEHTSSCVMLLAHKHRNENVTRKLFNALHAVGVELRPVSEGMMPKLSIKTPTVRLYSGKLW